MKCSSLRRAAEGKQLVGWERGKGLDTDIVMVLQSPVQDEGGEAGGNGYDGEYGNDAYGVEFVEEVDEEGFADEAAKEGVDGVE